MRIPLFIFLVFWFSNSLFAQSPPKAIALYEKHITFEGSQDYIFNEPHLYINKSDSKHWLVSTIATKKGDWDNFRTMTLVSFDAGNTWDHTFFGEYEAADPWGIINSEGHAIFTHLGPPEEGVYTYYSEDGGKTWNQDPYLIKGNLDHQTMTQNLKTNTLYITADKSNSVLLAVSTDNGRTFSEQKAHRLTDMSTTVTTVSVDHTGKLYIPFTTYQRRGLEKRLWLDKTLSWVITSDDNAQTISPMSLIGNFCERSFPVFTIDTSNSDYQGRGYYVCASQSDRGIVFQHSSNDLSKWSEPVILSKFTFKEPRDRNPFTGSPQIIVNNKGTVGVAWKGRQPEPNSDCDYLFFMYSNDGGKTFSDATQVSKALSCPDKEGNDWLGYRWPTGGDYFGLDTNEDGQFIVVWPDSRKEYFQLYQSTIAIPD